MDQKYKLLIKNVSYLAIGNFASKLLVFLLVPLYTNVLSTEEYGNYDAITTTVALLTPLLIANISDGVMRFLLDNKNNEKEIMSIGFKFVSIGIMIIGVLLLVNRHFQFVYFLDGYELLTFVYAAFHILNSHITQCAKGLNKVSIIAKAGFLSTFVMIAANILFLLVFHYGIMGFFLANIIGLISPTIYYCIKIHPFKYLSIRSVDNQLQKEMLVYSMPLIFNTIGWTINSSLDKYCVIYFYGIAVSGVLAVAYKIPTILSVIYSMFTQAWQISAVAEYENKDRENFYSSTFLFTNGLGSLCCACLLLGNKTLSRFLFAKEFYHAWQYVPFLLISVLFNQTAGFIGPLLSAKRESNAMAKAAIIGALANFLCNIIFIKIFGIQGATIATAVSSFVIYYVRWLYAKDLLKKRIYPQLYSSWVLIIISAFAEIYNIGYLIQIMSLIGILIINRKEYHKVFNLIPIKRENE